MASESIAKLLGDSAEVRSIAERLQLIKRLQRRFRTLVPESLADASRVCAIDGTIVVVCASSGPVAAALRHLAPRLLEGLRGVRRNPKHPRDQELTSLRVEVQVERTLPRAPVVGRPELPREKIARLASTLGDSPLKRELERMAGDGHIRSTREKT